jgi:hypothetical protein
VVRGLHGEQHLEQRVAGQRPLRVEVLHQELERHVLVRVRGQVRLPDPAEELGERRVARQVGAQYEVVDEEADQVFHGLVGAPGDRGPDRDVLPGAQAGQEHGERGLDDHEDAGVVGAGDVRHALVQGGRHVELDALAAVRRARGAGPVGGQGQFLGEVGERGAPVLQLAGEQALPVVRRAEFAALPQGEVGVLHR